MSLTRVVVSGVLVGVDGLLVVALGVGLTQSDGPTWGQFWGLLTSLLGLGIALIVWAIRALIRQETGTKHQENLSRMDKLKEGQDEMRALFFGVRGGWGYLQEQEYLADNVHWLAGRIHTLEDHADEVGRLPQIQCPYTPPTEPRPRRRQHTRRSDPPDA